MVVLAAVRTAPILCPFSTPSTPTSPTTTTSTTSMASTASTTTSVEACSRFGVDDCGFHLVLFLGLLQYGNEILNGDVGCSFKIANGGRKFRWRGRVDVGS